MRSILGWLVATSAMAALGCAGTAGAPTAPIDTIPNGTQAALGEAISTGRGTEMPLALYTIKLDTAGMTASVEPKQVRSMAAAGSDVYNLCVSDFFPSPPIKITNIEITGSSLSLSYDVTHPFAAPTNLAGPASAGNRADLGISGSCVFLTDAGLPPAAPSASTFTFAGGDVVMNADIVTNPHGYCQPDDVLDLTGFTCNSFPYRVLVDETDTECRTVTATGAAITTTSNVGNYNAAAGGWQASNIGASNAAWSGYGVLHQGQTASSVVDLDLQGIQDYVTAEGAFSLDMALLATYNDPRGGTTAADKKRNRLPSATGDVTAFFYDMPHGATAMERVTMPDQTWDLLAGPPATASLSCVTWDAAATCTVTMSCDAMFGQPITFTTSPTGSGTPSDPLAWTEDIAAAVLPACPAGEYDVCVKIESTSASSFVLLDCSLALKTGSFFGKSKELTGHVTLIK